MNLPKNERPRRRQSGVIMASADLIIFVPVMVGALVLFIDSALSYYYKERMSFVVTQAANYAVNLPPSEDAISQTEKVTKDLLKCMGITSSDLKIKVEQTTVADEDAIRVTATGTLPLAPGGLLPPTLAMQDSATALIPANRVCGLVSINPYPYSYSGDNTTSLYLPIMQSRPQLPIWAFPADPTISNLHIVQGLAPEAPKVISPKNYVSGHPSLY